MRRFSTLLISRRLNAGNQNIKLGLLLRMMGRTQAQPSIPSLLASGIKSLVCGVKAEISSVVRE
jgi:hypothetical protein